MVLRATGIVPGQIPGTTTNDIAAAGNVGEYLTGTIASGAAVTLATGTPLTVTSVALTAGDWNVWGVVDFIPAALTSITQLIAGCSQTTNTFAGQDTFNQSSFAAEVPGANVTAQLTPVRRITAGAPITAFLIAQATFTAAGLTAYGTIFARRAR